MLYLLGSDDVGTITAVQANCAQRVTWYREVPFPILVSPVLSDNEDILYVACGRANAQSPSGAILALNSTTGEDVWPSPWMPPDPTRAASGLGPGFLGETYVSPITGEVWPIKSIAGSRDDAVGSYNVESHREADAGLLELLAAEAEAADSKAAVSRAAASDITSGAGLSNVAAAGPAAAPAQGSNNVTGQAGAAAASTNSSAFVSGELPPNATATADSDAAIAAAGQGAESDPLLLRQKDATYRALLSWAAAPSAPVVTDLRLQEGLLVAAVATQGGHYVIVLDVNRTSTAGSAAAKAGRSGVSVPALPALAWSCIADAPVTQALAIAPGIAGAAPSTGLDGSRAYAVTATGNVMAFSLRQRTNSPQLCATSGAGPGLSTADCRICADWSLPLAGRLQGALVAPPVVATITASGVGPSLQQAMAQRVSNAATQAAIAQGDKSAPWNASSNAVSGTGNLQATGSASGFLLPVGSPAAIRAAAVQESPTSFASHQLLLIATVQRDAKHAGAVYVCNVTAAAGALAVDGLAGDRCRVLYSTGGEGNAAAGAVVVPSSTAAGAVRRLRGDGAEDDADDGGHIMAHGSLRRRGLQVAAAGTSTTQLVSGASSSGAGGSAVASLPSFALPASSFCTTPLASVYLPSLASSTLAAGAGAEPSASSDAPVAFLSALQAQYRIPFRLLLTLGTVSGELMMIDATDAVFNTSSAVQAQPEAASETTARRAEAPPPLGVAVATPPPAGSSSGIAASAVSGGATNAGIYMVWRKGLQPGGTRGIVSGPVSNGNLTAAGTAGGYFQVIRALDGETVWRMKIPRSGRSSAGPRDPVLSLSRGLLVDGQGRVYLTSGAGTSATLITIDGRCPLPQRESIYIALSVLGCVLAASGVCYACVLSLSTWSLVGARTACEASLCCWCCTRYARLPSTPGDHKNNEKRRRAAVNESKQHPRSRQVAWIRAKLYPLPQLPSSQPYVVPTTEAGDSGGAAVVVLTTGCAAAELTQPGGVASLTNRAAGTGLDLSSRYEHCAPPTLPDNVAAAAADDSETHPEQLQSPVLRRRATGHRHSASAPLAAMLGQLQSTPTGTVSAPMGIGKRPAPLPQTATAASAPGSHRGAALGGASAPQWLPRRSRQQRGAEETRPLSGRATSAGSGRSAGGFLASIWRARPGTARSGMSVALSPHTEERRGVSDDESDSSDSDGGRSATAAAAAAHTTPRLAALVAAAAISGASSDAPHSAATPREAATPQTASVAGTHRMPGRRPSLPRLSLSSTPQGGAPSHRLFQQRPQSAREKVA